MTIIFKYYIKKYQLLFIIKNYNQIVKTLKTNNYLL